MNNRIRSTLVVAISAFSLLATANAADVPKRKSGLWEIAMQANGQGGMTMQTCVDEKQDDLTAQQSKDAQNEARKRCTKMDTKRVGGGFEIDSVCQFDKVTATSHTIVTGNMTRQYKMDATTRFTPPMQGMAQSHTVMTGKWLGPCKPGQKTGSVTMMGMSGGGHARITPEMMRQMEKMKQRYGH